MSQLRKDWGNWPRRCLFLALVSIVPTAGIAGRTTKSSSPKAAHSSAASKKVARQDDSFNSKPSADLGLSLQSAHKADALTHFVEGMSLEENGEMDRALEAYRKVLNVDPGQSQLASRVAALLIDEDDFPQAIDVLKDAIKANPNDADPYQQLAYIYAKYLKKTDQAIEYANRAITLNPGDIEGYQRLVEIEMAAGQEKKALEVLDRAAKVHSDAADFWMRLGKLYVALLFKSDSQPKPDQLKRTNEIFKKAAERADDDPAILKDVADYYAASQQLKEAIPLYLRVLELQPDDANAREKLATGFILTNQRGKAVEMLEQIIKEHPEKYQPYDLLAQVLDDEARSLQRAKKVDEAKAIFAKVAANYEQSLLINPNHVGPYLHLAELLLGPLKNAEHAVRLLTEARRRFMGAPEIVYYLAIAQSEAKQTQQAVATFEEALHEAQLDQDNDIINAKFYFNYGATAEQAGLYDKAADLLRKSIALDPANSAEACNYLGYMWADHNMNLDEAETMIKHALEMEPKNASYLDSFGWVQFRKGKFDQALINLLNAAKTADHEDPVIFEHIGDAYFKLNRISEAVESWQKALALDPKNKNLANKIERTKTPIGNGPPAKTNPTE
ncbi:MAG TPA: tetratricopeptide repeat protein [Candidatus Udaeobacter sp.]|nr:tetratricopeptide repeat protein [Candidatus Udaeobacter sp.]